MTKRVIVYSTAACPYCVKLKNFLKNENIEFENIDVAVDQAKAEEMVQKSRQMGVPVIDIEGTIIVGFDKSKIKTELGLE